MKRFFRQAKGKQKGGIEPLTALGLVGALAFFVGSGFIATTNLTTLHNDTQRLIKSQEVITALDRLLSSTQDAETGQRGFLLTFNDRYLEPYNAALSILPSRLDEIARLTSDNVQQQANLIPLKLHVEGKLAELKETIALRRVQGLDAALALVNTDRGKVEMDAVRAQVAIMSREEIDLRTRRLGEMNGAYQTALTSGILAGVLGAGLTMLIGLLVRRATKARQREEWIQSGEVGLAAAMLGDQDTRQLGDSILGFLARYFGAAAGAIYVGGNQRFQLMASYGVPESADIPAAFSGKDGLLGQAVLEGRALFVDDVPPGYLSYGSALGQSDPRYLIIAPAVLDGAVNAVIELGFTGPADEATAAFLEKAMETIAVAVRAANYRLELQELVEETQRKSEELQVQGEELRVSNEELEEQSRALKESQARLEQQQAELEQTNSQLEEQAQLLESQRDDLEKINASVKLKAQELEQASQYKSDFLANMSHELRTPLNSSLILAKLLADNPEDNLTQEQVKYAQTIQSSGNDLLSLINDILDLSKIEAGHVEIRPDVISMDHLIGNIRRVFQPIADEKKLEFSIDVSPQCPEAITTDLQRLEQVLKNLLSNAFKFTERGKVVLAIAPSDSQLAFAVADSGIGIDEQQQQSIFEAFKQADGSISRKFGGTGLGLSISRELCRLLGGSIQLKSRPGYGSTFTVLLPISYDAAKVRPRDARNVAALAPDIAPLIESVPVPAPAMHGKVKDDRHCLSGGQRILLVIEDDETFASIIRDLSHDMGFQSLVATTADEALHLAKQYMPSAVILDVGLPDQSGLSVLDRLKRDVETRHIPIHVISGGDHAQTAMSLGAVGYMVKPAERDQLADILKKLEAKFSQKMHRVLIVEDDQHQRDAVGQLLSSQDVQIATAGTAAECLTLLKQHTFDCMVLDLSLPDASGYTLLETLSKEEAYSFPPAIVYTGHDLSADEEQKLRRYSRSIIIKGAKSPERLLDEVSLFLHQVVSDLPDEHQKMIRKARSRDAILEGRRILVVEDDVRNIYALTNILEPRGAVVEIARNGQEALDMLSKSSAAKALSVDLVLMDVMMPVMDGLTATQEIRKNPDWKKLPIITLTAKAMPDDQRRCIEAGANDYMAKPLDVEKLLSLVRVWMPR